MLRTHLQLGRNLLLCVVASVIWLQTACSQLGQANENSALVKAQAAFRTGDWAGADAQLRRYLATTPKAAQALYLLALTLFHEDRPKESLQMYTRAAAQRRPTPEDFRIVALDYVLLNDFGDAEPWATRAVTEDPRDGESWYALGRIQFTNQKLPAAVDSFHHALALLPHSVKTENNLGVTLENLNQPEQAIAAYQQAIGWVTGDTPQNAQPFLNLGILLTDRGRFTDALPLLQRAESMSPKDARVHGALGKLYARREDLPAAQRELEQAVAASPQDAALHFQLGQVYRKEGMTARASVELQRSADLEREERR